MKHFGIYEDVLKYTVHDDGLKFVYGDDTVAGAFPVEKTGGPGSLVKEIEIMRSDFVQILFDRTKQNVEYIFDDSIAKLDQYDAGVTVTFANQKETTDYDIVAVADGLRGHTRDLAFEPDNSQIVRLRQYCGFMNIPWQPSDGTWTRWYNAPLGKCVCLRPNAERGTTSAYLAQVTEDSDSVVKLPVEEQRDEMQRRFVGAGWEAERVLEQLHGESGKTFYLQEAAQVKSTLLVKGRVALLGDAGYCPSPLTGQGTSLALVGAYILAGCIATYNDHKEALEQYEKQIRLFVDSIQQLPPGVPWIVNPQTATGIRILNNLVWVGEKIVNYSIAAAISKVAAWMPSFGGKGLVLPEFPAVAEKGPSAKLA